MFGGFGSFGLHDDTWLWDGSRWTEATITGAVPSARSGHAMAYDAGRKRVVMFGGQTDAGHGADTWEWDGTAWTEVAPTGPSPPGRILHGMAYDPASGVVVMFGGTTTGGRLGGTWLWDGTTWTQRIQLIAPPPPRQEHALAFDVTRQRVVMFGGTPGGLGYLGDTWLYAHHAAGPEQCETGFDADGDGLTGCADPDCWGYCTPVCPPDTTCAPTSPRCGDGVPNADLESCRLCPADVGACAPACGDGHCDTGETTATGPAHCTPSRHRSQSQHFARPRRRC